tara:strand:+ start:46221 stop:46538 length:318 start_codon:yes stop_codon:yes gene_type:complete
MSDKKDFFKRKEVADVALPTHGEYDPTNFENDMTACGITDIEGFQARHAKLFNNLVVDSKHENPVATVTKRVEEAFTQREIAFLLTKDLLQVAYQQSVESLKQQK